MTAIGDQAQGVSKIRVARADDAPRLAAIYAPYVTETAISFETDPPDAAEMARRIAKVLTRLPWLVCEQDGVIVGYAYASAHRDRAAYQWSVDVAVYVDRTAHRKGVGRALYAPLLAILRRLGFHQAYAGITLPNDASVGLHETMGFTPVGVYREVGYKAGGWRDVGWWGLILGPGAPDPTVPAAFEDGMLG